MQQSTLISAWISRDAAKLSIDLGSNHGHARLTPAETDSLALLCWQRLQGMLPQSLQTDSLGLLLWQCLQGTASSECWEQSLASDDPTRAFVWPAISVPIAFQVNCNPCPSTKKRKCTACGLSASTFMMHQPSPPHNSPHAADWEHAPGGGRRGVQGMEGKVEAGPDSRGVWGAPEIPKGPHGMPHSCTPSARPPSCEAPAQRAGHMSCCATYGPAHFKIL